MKTLIALSVLALSQSSIASSPLLIKEIGGIAHAGKVSTCEVHPNHPAVAGRLKEIDALMAQAAKGELARVAVFSRAQVPSEEITAIRSITRGETVVQQRIVLEKVYGDRQARTSEEAKALIELVETICK